MRTSSRSGPRAGRSDAGGYGAVAAGRRPPRAALRTRPSRADRDDRDLHVPDRDQLDEVPRRIEAQAVADREGGEQQDRPREPQREDERRAPEAWPLRTCGQPEPGVQRRQDEDQRERVCCQDEQRDDAQRRAVRPSRPRAARPVSRGGGARAGAARRSSRASDDGEPDQRDARASRRRWPCRGRAAAARAGRPGAREHGRRRTRDRRRARTRARLRRLRAAGARRMPRRRQWAKRSTAPTRNGMSSPIRSSCDGPAADDPVARPDERRRPLRQLRALVERADQVSAPRGPSRPAAPRSSDGRRSVNASGGRSPAVVRVSAGMPRATNGPCS